MSDPGVRAKLAAVGARCRHDPLLFAEVAWRWGEGGLAGQDIRRWQADVLGAISDHLQDPERRFQPLRIAVASGHGVGKGNPVKSRIYTPAGERRWGDLRVGDYLFGADGRPTRITGIPFEGVCPFYRVTFDDGTVIECTEGHLWNVRGRQERRNGLDTWRTLETREIVALGVKRANGAARARQWEIPRQGPARFPSRPVPHDPYTLGVWLGDGCCSSAQISKPDDDVRRACGGRPFCADGAQFSVPGLSKALRMLDMYRDSGDRKRVPGLLMHNDIETRKAVLAGLLDTDADCCAGYSIEFANTSHGLCEDVLWLARSLGYKARISGEKPSSYRDADGDKVECRPHWRVRITADENPFRHCHHKRDAWAGPTQERYLTRWIESIEPIGEIDGMCVSVAAPDGLYLADEFTVTHNSALHGMLTTWALACYSDPRIVLTANTEGQLRTKTSPEVGSWVRSSAFGELFDVDTLSVKLAERPEQHRADFIAWSEHRPEAFAGLHARGRLVMVQVDEGSAVADTIFETIDGALTDAETVLLLLVTGNPTRNRGTFREAFRRQRDRWKTWQIDSRDVEGVNREALNDLIATHGIDSDVAKVRVLGRFPSASAYQFIPTDLVDAAYGRHLRKDQYEFAPVILACDPAWTGDDELVIVKRQGLYSEVLKVMERNDNDGHVATLLAHLEHQHNASAVFIDMGFGTGIYSAGRNMGRDWQLVNFGAKAVDSGCKNKRVEMWRDMREWLREGGALPPDQKLYEDLIAVDMKPMTNGVLELASKNDLRRDGFPSPDRADALALTFASPVVHKYGGPARTGPQDMVDKDDAVFVPFQT